MKKYEITNKSIEFEGKTLYRIKALHDFNDVKTGDLGGFVESEDNLSHHGDCWIYGNTKVLDDAYVDGNARVLGNAVVSHSSRITENANMQECIHFQLICSRSCRNNRQCSYSLRINNLRHNYDMR